MLPVLSWAGGRKPVVKRNPLEKCTEGILFLKHHHLADCSGCTHMPHNDNRSKTGTKLPQRYISKAPRYIFLHSVAVQETRLMSVALVPLHPSTRKRRLVSQSLPKPDCSFQSQPLGPSCSPALELLEASKFTPSTFTGLLITFWT